MDTTISELKKLGLNKLPWHFCAGRNPQTLEIMYKTIHQYYLYILTNKKNGTLYIGVTNDLERRMFEHKNKLVEGFTKKYGLNRLMYFEVYQYVNDAIKREKNMKKWKRAWKIKLIEEDNPKWEDLSQDWEYLIE